MLALEGGAVSHERGTLDLPAPGLFFRVRALFDCLVCASTVLHGLDCQSGVLTVLYGVDCLIRAFTCRVGFAIQSGCTSFRWTVRSGFGTWLSGDLKTVKGVLIYIHIYIYTYVCIYIYKHVYIDMDIYIYVYLLSLGLFFRVRLPFHAPRIRLLVLMRRVSQHLQGCLMFPRKALRGDISKSILQRPCHFLAINAHKMAPRTT